MKRFLLTILTLATVFLLAACQESDVSGGQSSSPISTEQENSQSESGQESAPQESTPAESAPQENNSGTQESAPPETSEKEENSGSSENSGTQGDVEIPEEDDGYADIEFPRPQ